MVKRTRSLILIGMVMAQAPLRAESAAPSASPEPAQAAPVKPLKDAAELSLVSTDGNTRTTSASGKDTFSYSWDQSLLELAAGALYAENKGTATAEEYFANEKVARNITEKNFVYEKIGWDRNRFAGIRSRADSSLGFGRPLVDFPHDKLTAELGTGYVDEERTDMSSHRFVSGRADLHYVHAFSSTSNFDQSVEYLPNVSDDGDYRINTETALTAAVSSHLSLKVSYDWKHNNQPPPGFEPNDSTTSVALVVNY